MSKNKVSTEQAAQSDPLLIGYWYDWSLHLKWMDIIFHVHLNQSKYVIYLIQPINVLMILR